MDGGMGIEKRYAEKEQVREISDRGLNISRNIDPPLCILEPHQHLCTAHLIRNIREGVYCFGQHNITGGPKVDKKLAKEDDAVDHECHIDRVLTANSTWQIIEDGLEESLRRADMHASFQSLDCT